MLRYSLVCNSGHEFEGWFRDSAGFDAQARGGFLSCAICGSSKVSKAIMAPAIARRETKSARSAQSGTISGQLEDHASSSSAGSACSPAPVALISEEEKTMRAALKALRQHVETHAENVGTDFAAKARLMHEGDIEQKSIYGVATPEEVSALHEDGIEAQALPLMPEERN